MQVQVDIEYEQLLKIVKDLPAGKLRQLKAAIEQASVPKKTASTLEDLLLNGPVATKKQLEKIMLNRKSITEWRVK